MRFSWFSWACTCVLVDGDGSSLKSSAVSSSRFWAIKGFSAALGSPSVFDSVRHVYLHSCFKVALSAYLTATSSLFVPGIIADAPIPLSYPTQMAEACWVGACVDIFSAPWPSPLHCGVLWGFLSLLSSPSVSWGLCALVSASLGPLHCGACAHLFQPPGLPPVHCSVGVHWFWFRSLSGLQGHLFCLTGLPSVSACVFFFGSSGPTSVQRAELCAPALGLYLFSAPYLPLPTRAVLGRLVCHATLGYPGLPSVLLDFCGLSQFPEPLSLAGATVSELFKGWEVQVFLFCAL